MAVLVAAALLALIAVAVPAVLSDGVGALEGRDRAAAEDAVRLVGVACMDHPLSRLFARKVRVESVRYVPGRCRGGTAAGSLRGYRVVLRVHTFFGVPRQTIVACGGEFVCYPDEAARRYRLACAQHARSRAGARG